MQGSVLERARESVGWPQMNKDITQLIENCNTCIMISRTKHYILIALYLPQERWGVVGTDLFEYKGKDFYLLIISQGG